MPNHATWLLCANCHSNNISPIFLVTAQLNSSNRSCPLRDKLTLRDSEYLILKSTFMNDPSELKVIHFKAAHLRPYTFAFDSKIDIHQYQWSPDVSITASSRTISANMWQTDRHTCRQALCTWKLITIILLINRTKVMWSLLLQDEIKSKCHRV